MKVQGEPIKRRIFSKKFFEKIRLFIGSPCNVKFFKILSKSYFSSVFTGVYVFFIKKFKYAKKLVSTGGSNPRPLGPSLYSIHSDPRGRGFEPPVETNFF